MENNSLKQVRNELLKVEKELLRNSIERVAKMEMWYPRMRYEKIKSVETDLILFH